MKDRRVSDRVLSTVLLSILFTVMFACSIQAQPTAIRRIGVLTPGGDFGSVVEGLRQGLAEAGYEEGKQITLIVEDTKMETLDPVKAALRLVAANPDLLVTVATSHAAAAKAAWPGIFPSFSRSLQTRCSPGLWRATPLRRTILPESRTAWRSCPASGSRC